MVILAAALADPRTFHPYRPAPFVGNFRDDIDDPADGIGAVARRPRTANDLNMVDIIEADTIRLVGGAVEFAQSPRQTAAVNKDQGVAGIRAADRNRLTPHIIRAHLNILFGGQRVRKRPCALAVDVLPRDKRLRLRRFFEHFLLINRFDVNRFRRHSLRFAGLFSLFGAKGRRLEKHPHGGSKRCVCGPFHFPCLFQHFYLLS